MLHAHSMKRILLHAYVLALKHPFSGQVRETDRLFKNDRDSTLSIYPTTPTSHRHTHDRLK